MKYLSIIIFLVLSYSSHNQTVSKLTSDTISITHNVKSNPAPVEPAPISSPSKFGVLSSFEFTLSIAVLCFGLLIIILEIYLVRSKKLNQETLVKFILVTLIITGTLFLITAGYNNNQIAPAAGLFGTIAGYLLGKASTKKDDNEI
jgi:cytochrome bd-type quinol oxidase subunit 1